MSTYAAAMDSSEVKLGIDIGGTGIKGAPVDLETGELRRASASGCSPRNQRPRKRSLSTVAEVVKHFGYQGMVGCTFPGVVKHGVIQTAANVDKAWIGTDARAHSRTRPGALSP